MPKFHPLMTGVFQIGLRTNAQVQSGEVGYIASELNSLTGDRRKNVVAGLVR
jgi:hypothetical protein